MDGEGTRWNEREQRAWKETEGTKGDSGRERKRRRGRRQRARAETEGKRGSEREGADAEGASGEETEGAGRWAPQADGWVGSDP